jgi:hypothetical protein
MTNRTSCRRRGDRPALNPVNPAIEMTPATEAALVKRATRFILETLTSSTLPRR